MSELITSNLKHSLVKMDSIQFDSSSNDKKVIPKNY